MIRLELVHPGGVLKHEFMEPYALSVSVLRLACCFNMNSRHWMNLQGRYEIETATLDNVNPLFAIRLRAIA